MNNSHNHFSDPRKDSIIFIRRILFAFVGMLLLFIILLGNLYFLQVIHYDDYSTRSNSNRIKIIPIAPDRGSIFDRFGVPLSLNQTIYNLEIVVDEKNNKKLQQIFDEFRELINLTDDDILNYYKERKKVPSYSFVTLKSKLTEEQIAIFSVNQYKYPFAKIREQQHRYYPYGSTLTHLLGYVSKINEKDITNLTESGQIKNYAATSTIGKLGIEKYYESTLHGKPGYAEVEVDSRGQIVRHLTESLPTAGNDIYLTIDLDLQEYVTNLFTDKRGAAIVMDPNNGEILALVSSPSYDPNLFVDGISSKNYKTLLNDPNKPLFNRATQGLYPPASTIKGFIAVSALSEKVITPDTTIYDVGWWQIPKTQKKYRDWRRRGHGRVNLTYSIEGSVDTYYYQIAYNMGIDRLHEWMTKFGFGQYSGIDLSKDEQQRGIMPSREWKLKRHKSPWLQGDTIPVGIGQGYWNASPIQLAKALVTLINDGNPKTPHLMKKIVKSDSESDYSSIEEKPISGVNHEYWGMAKNGMYGVLHRPTGTAYKVFRGTSYKAAGKSGTAQVYSLKKDEVYNAKALPEHLRDHALFIAYAPYEKPKIAISLILENGGGGSASGGVLARKIIDYILIGQKQKKIAENQNKTKEQGNE